VVERHRLRPFEQGSCDLITVDRWFITIEAWFADMDWPVIDNLVIAEWL